MKNICRHALLVFFAFLISSCATTTRYYTDLDILVRNENYQGAADFAEKSKLSAYGEKNALLYWLDRGMLLHLAGQYSASSEAFERAKTISEEYFTKSITAEASTLLVSDNMRPYYGEDFERALINVFGALNYIFLENEPEAVVEAKQVDFFLTTLQTKYGYKGVYKEDAFARYLMGMIYENQGQLNDACISYAKALEAYEQYESAYFVPVPQMLVKDALRCAAKLGITDDVRELEKKWEIQIDDAPWLPKGSGELVILDYNGMSPVKIDSIFEISFGRAWIYVGEAEPEGEEEEQVEQARAIARNILSEEQVRMAFPKYVSSPYAISEFSAEAGGLDSVSRASSRGVLVENIGGIAVKSLEDRVDRIRIRTIIRAAIKFALTHKIAQKVEENNQNEVLTWLVKKSLSVASAATELADKRSWRSLPDRILMARLVLPEGAHDVDLTFTDNSGRIILRKTLQDVRIRPGKKTFAVVRTAI
ncbi:MAG: hypothetical protein ABII64_00160 [Elusimicrobiota bacterium]